MRINHQTAWNMRYSNLSDTKSQIVRATQGSLQPSSGYLTERWDVWYTVSAIPMSTSLLVGNWGWGSSVIGILTSHISYTPNGEQFGWQHDRLWYNRVISMPCIEGKLWPNTGPFPHLDSEIWGILNPESSYLRSIFSVTWSTTPYWMASKAAMVYWLGMLV